MSNCACGGVHALAPLRSDDTANIRFAGVGYQLPRYHG